MQKKYPVYSKKIKKYPVYSCESHAVYRERSAFN